jgi:cytochrome b pre-mRNA-processing protein 3
MIFRLFRRDPRAGTIGVLYGTIVAQARRPVFYLEFGVPDTAEGRFDILVLHLALFCHRLARESGEAERDGHGVRQHPSQALNHSLSQGVFDLFCRDMDHSLREMGVGDLTVPKKMHKLGEAFYGRLKAYERALAAPRDDELASALARNVLGQAAISACALRLAAYVRAAADKLDTVPAADLATGLLGFPDPEMIPKPVHEAQA